MKKMKQEAYAIKFSINLDLDINETVYMSCDAFNKLPCLLYCGIHDTDSIIPKYFTKKKIKELKRKICEQIMNSENPFSIHEVDLNGYLVEEDKIWK